MDKIEILKNIIETSNQIVLFTGAGISVPSGIPDFRSSGGIFNKKLDVNYSPEEIISKTFFYKNSKLFYNYYKKYLIYPNALPNKAHIYFSNLEKQGKLKAIITQNIDNLHQEASSKNVLELHGSIYRNYCTKCMKNFNLDYIIKSEDVPICDECSNIIKPDVVLYEENLNETILSKSITAIRNCDCMIVVGTSLLVYPAASLVRYFTGKNLVLINKQSTPYDDIADLVINEDIIEVINKL